MIYIHMLKHLLVKGVLFLYLIAFFQRSRRFVFRSADDVRWWASCHGSQALLQLYYSSLNIRAVLLLQPLSQLLWGFRQCFHCFLLCYLQEPRSGFMPHQLGNVHGTVTLRCCAVKRYPSSQQHLNCLVLPVPCRLMQGCHSSRIHQFFVQLLVFKQESKHLNTRFTIDNNVMQEHGNTSSLCVGAQAAIKGDVPHWQSQLRPILVSFRS
mmetsp:Transcript_5564/g.19553  ORF Transcript_5564/g.19553 Transcript_5564/m.19553 type:complete len:210 (+) Transcript_5564:1218-1847(+)